MEAWIIVIYLLIVFVIMVIIAMLIENETFYESLKQKNQLDRPKKSVRNNDRRS